MQRNQAIVAIARRLLELIWFVLSRKQPRRLASEAELLALRPELRQLE